MRYYSDDDFIKIVRMVIDTLTCKVHLEYVRPPSQLKFLMGQWGNLYEHAAAKRRHAPSTQTADFKYYLYASNGITKISAGRVGVGILENLYGFNPSLSGL